MPLPGTAVPDRAFRLPQTHLAGLRAGLATDPGPEFRLRLTPQLGGATAGAGGFDDSGRSQPRAGLLVRLRARNGEQVALEAGDRIRVTSREPLLTDDWELLRPPEPLRARRRLIGFTAEAERVSLLYPLLASLQELGGAVVDAAVPVSLYRASDERPERAGLVGDWSGEAPYAYLAALSVANRQLAVDGRTLRIVQAAAHHAIPRVTLRLREGRAA